MQMSGTQMFLLHFVGQSPEAFEWNMKIRERDMLWPTRFSFNIYTIRIHINFGMLSLVSGMCGEAICLFSVYFCWHRYHWISCSVCSPILHSPSAHHIFLIYDVARHHRPLHLVCLLKLMHAGGETNESKVRKKIKYNQMSADRKMGFCSWATRPNRVTRQEF